MKPLSYREAVAELEARGVMPDRPPSLEPTKEGFRRVGFGTEFAINPANVVVVAGTNGKGSTSMALATLLAEAGHKVGLYTSPHLIETTERIRVVDASGSREISQNDFCLIHARVAEATRDLKLTHFEMLTVMALLYFGSSYAHVDKVILEVGLGGSWDSTNAVPHSTGVITPLAMDHQNILGATLKDIAGNKFGIIEKENLVVHAPLPKETRALAEKVRERTSSRWVERMDYVYEVVPGLHSDPRFTLNTGDGIFETPFPGERGAQNAALALTVFRELENSRAGDADLIRRAFAKTRWPGRMEKMLHVPKEGGDAMPIYLSGDHNPQGVQSLLEILAHYPPRMRWSILFGIGKDKALKDTLEPLFQKLPNAKIFLTETPFKGLPLDGYGSYLDRAAGASSNPHEAFEMALRSDADAVLVTGSLYLVGLLKSTLT